MGLIHAITLKQEEIAGSGGHSIRGRQKALSHRGGTSGTTIFNDVDGLEESKTQSRGLGRVPREAAGLKGRQVSTEVVACRTITNESAIDEAWLKQLFGDFREV
jgi:hypothetical protein